MTLGPHTVTLEHFAIALAIIATPAVALAGDGSGYHPWVKPDRAVKTIEMSAAAMQARGDALIATPQARGDWTVLDRVQSSDSHLQLDRDPPRAVDPAQVGKTPDGWVQRGSVVLPAAVANGDLQVDPAAIFAVEDIPGNEYPRKHTLYLNFIGEDLSPGTDNSAENKSQLAKDGNYPAYEGGNQKAVSIAQAVAEDVAAYGIRVLYLPEERPSQTVPYTMEMMGGQWQDTNIDSPAGGVAPGADCGALGQRHIVYTFASGGLGVNSAANTASQEAGHGWGLDHTFNCGSVMSYCGIANGVFSTQCDGLCEAQCQGTNSAGCRLTHEMFCGEGNDQQNDHEELTWIFGTNEPDVEDPFVNIISPEDGQVFESSADVDLRAEVGDDYGGYGWKFFITHNGNTVLDAVDYERDVDDEFRAALNLTQLEDGEWSITVEVEDQFDHIASQTVTIIVGEGGPLPGDTGNDDSGDGLDDGMADDGTGDAGSDDAATASDGTGTANEVDDSPGGCECRTRPGVPGSAMTALLFLVFAGAARRRSRD